MLDLDQDELHDATWTYGAASTADMVNTVKVEESGEQVAGGTAIYIAKFSTRRRPRDYRLIGTGTEKKVENRR